MVWTLAVEQLVNRALALDPGALDRLARLAGRSIGVEVRGSGLRFLVFMAGDGIHLAPWPADATEAEAPDTIVSGPPLALLRLATSDAPYQSLFKGEVTVEGDTALLERLRGILGRADIDWEEPLARFVGDPLGHQLARALRGLGGWSGQARRTLEEDAREFLQEEARLLVRGDEVRAFNRAVDVLRDDVARLEARLARLEEPAGTTDDAGS